MMASSSNRYSIPVLLVVWFWVWGICPWNSPFSPPEASNVSQTDHGHHGIDDTHHASKGTEHSCSGSIPLTESNLKSDRILSDSVSPIGLLLSEDAAIGPIRIDRFQKHLFERHALPKLLTEYYQLYSVYRI